MKLHCNVSHLRTKQVSVLSEFLGIDLELQHYEAKKLQKPEFQQKSVAGKIPLLESKDGSVFETLAIQLYLASFQTQLNLTGTNDFSKSQVSQWVLYIQNDLEVPVEILENLNSGNIPANNDLKQKAQQDVALSLSLLDKQLQLRTFLVDHQITIADINLAVTVEKLSQLKEFDANKYIDLNRHFNFVSQQSPFLSSTQKIQKVSELAQQQALQNQQAQEKQQQQKQNTDKKVVNEGQNKQSKEQKQEAKEQKKEKKEDQQIKQVEQKSQPKQVVESELGEPTDDEFASLDIRVGKIVECWKHAESENLYCEKIDIGEGSVREIGSGLQKFIPIEEMSGLVLVLANLKPRKLAGFNSNGMVLCASNGDHTKVELMRPPKDCKVGERITLEQYNKINQDYAPVLNPKKKELEKVLPYLKTDNNLSATFKGKKLLTSQGEIKCQTLNNCKIG